MNSYNMLRNICRKQTESSRKPRTGTILSPRIVQIQEFLPNTHEVDIFRLPTDIQDRINLYWVVNKIDPAKKTVVFLAHHDIVNVNSDNVLDNTASVANIISIGKALVMPDAPVNVVIAILDAEETCSFEFSGARRLADHINAGKFGEVSETINLELTAYGNIMWFEQGGNGAIYTANIPGPGVNTPYNDSHALRLQGVKSTCVGIFTEEDYTDVGYIGSCKTWALCHSIDDRFELANESDMVSLCQILIGYVLQLEQPSQV